MTSRYLPLTFGVLILLSGCMMVKGEPDYGGEIAGTQVEKPVTVVRDLAGVPHIYGETPEDVFFGLGYVMAQDRFFQMDLMRHVGQGRLSEWFCNVPLGEGLRLVHLDMLIKCFELQEKTLAALPRLSPENRILIESFTSGIKPAHTGPDKESCRPPGQRDPQVASIGTRL